MAPQGASNSPVIGPEKRSSAEAYEEDFGSYERTQEP